MSRIAPTENIQYPLRELHPSSQLDEVLTAVKRNYPIVTALNIVKHLEKEGPLTNELEIIEILEKLIKDGFVTREIRSVKTAEVEVTKEYISGPFFTDVAHYQITFEGRVRIDQDGGYQEIRKMAHEERTRIDKLEIEQRKISKNTFVLTLVGSFFALAILIITLLQYLLAVKDSYPLFPCLTC